MEKYFKKLTEESEPNDPIIKLRAKLERGDTVDMDHVMKCADQNMLSTCV